MKCLQVWSKMFLYPLGCILKKRSPIWAFFLPNARERKAYCRMCSRGISNNGTSAMIKHLSLHPAEYAQFTNMRNQKPDDKMAFEIWATIREPNQFCPFYFVEDGNVKKLLIGFHQIKCLRPNFFIPFSPCTSTTGSIWYSFTLVWSIMFLK